MTIYDRLLLKWESAGIAVAGPVEASQIADFECRQNVKVPPDLREYLERLGGMVAGEMDEASLSLHSFTEMFCSPVTMSLFQAPGKTAVVADFLIDSHLYVTLIDSSGSPRPVYVAVNHADGWRAWPIADSFNRFLLRYLSDAEHRISCGTR